jgi:glycosyltransferase involved in cell wall biosynthesis
MRKECAKVMEAHTTALIIPALNEERALEKLLAELPPQVLDHVIVVDNGSTDNTAQVAREAGAQVVSEPVRGYGRACWSGFCAAKKLGADILVFMDGDGSDNPSDLTAMLQPALEDQADLVIGSRVSPLAERGAVPAQAQLGNWLVSRVISLRYGVQLHDVGSFRVVRTRLLDALQMREMTFGWPVEMLAKTARAGHRIVELPLHYRRRQHGRSKVAGTLSGSIKAAYFMLRTTARYIGVRRKDV